MAETQAPGHEPLPLTPSPDPVFLIPLSGLVFEEYSRQGPAFTDYVSVEIVENIGPVLIATFDEFDEGYPYRRGRKKLIAITDQTEHVVVKVTRVSDIPGMEENSVEYIAYIKGHGWYKFARGDAKKITALPCDKVIEILQREDAIITVF